MAFLVLGCSDKTPTNLESGIILGVIYNNDPIKLSAVAKNKSGESLPDVLITYQTNSPEIAEVSNNAELRCKSSGDATLLLNGGGQTAMVNIKCRLISKIEVPKSVSFVIDSDEDNKVQSHVLNEKGVEIVDASVSVKSADEQILRIENGNLVPVQVGKTSVTYSSGSVSSSMDVSVSRRLKDISGPLYLADGQEQRITLPKGNYDIEIKVSPDATTGNGRGAGVTVKSTDFGCNFSEAPWHSFQCKVQDSTLLIITNPTAFGMGATMSGLINITQIPNP